MKQIERLLIEEFKKNNVNYDTKPMVDYVDDSFTDVLKSVIGVVKKLNYTHCCDELRDEYLQPELDKYKNIKVERTTGKSDM